MSVNTMVKKNSTGTLYLCESSPPPPTTMTKYYNNDNNSNNTIAITPSTIAIEKETQKSAAIPRLKFLLFLTITLGKNPFKWQCLT